MLSVLLYILSFGIMLILKIISSLIISGEIIILAWGYSVFNINEQAFSCGIDIELGLFNIIYSTGTRGLFWILYKCILTVIFDSKSIFKWLSKVSCSIKIGRTSARDMCDNAKIMIFLRILFSIALGKTARWVNGVIEHFLWLFNWILQIDNGRICGLVSEDKE